MIGTTLDRYYVEAELGAGGMATVYRVRHLTLGSLHALKVLKVQSASIRQRLVQEGRVQATLRHPNIVAVTDVIEVDGAPGLVMEFIDGPSLEGWLEENRPSLAQAQAIFAGILAGVARAHRQGLVHRDLKPGNVLLDSSGDDGIVPTVADFGLAKILDDEEGFGSQTRSGIAMGTPAYMAPEQVRSAKNVDQRADIFALGCILYELVGGDRPFKGEDLLETMTAVCSGEYPPLPASVPARVRATVAACLVVDRERRVADCAQVRALLAEPPQAAPFWRDTAAPALAEAGALESIAPTTSMARAVPAPMAEPAARRAQTFAPDSAVSLVMPARGDEEAPLTAAPSSLAKSTGWWPWLLGLGAGGVLVLVIVLIVVLAVGTVGWRAWGPGSEAPPRAPAQVVGGVAVEAGGPPAAADTEPPGASAPASPAPPERASAGIPATEPAGPAEVVSADDGPTPPAAAAKAPATAARSTTEANSLDSGIVVVAGDLAKVRFVGEAGSYSPGPVPPGKYTIRAKFDDQAAVSAGAVTVQTGDRLTISCNAELQMCKVQ